MTENDKTILEEEKENIKRGNSLCDTINSMIDMIGKETNGIRQQVYTPVHGLTSKEIQILVKNINHEYLFALPVVGHKATLYAAADYARQRGKHIPTSLLEKIAGLTKAQETEIAYRIYALGEMKELLLNHINRL